MSLFCIPNVCIIHSQLDKMISEIEFLFSCSCFYTRYFIHFKDIILRIDDSSVKKLGYIRIRILLQKGFHPILACYKVFLSSSESGGETACNSLVYPLLKLWLLHVLYTFFIFWITGLQPLYCLHDFLHETQIQSKSAAIAVLLYSQINTLWPNFNNCLDKSRFKLLSH